jgi:uncharacterized metal-binding protein YceD (DUF177 family)
MSEMSRPVALDRIGKHAEIDVEARAEELPGLAARLQIPAVARLSCRFRLERAGSEVIAAQGHLEAAVTRVCVVTLEEFEQDVREDFVVEFVPAGTETEDPDPEDVDQIPYPGGALDLGEAAVEQLALALDPYPRAPGAALPPEATDASAGAFAALAALRRKE